jgi:chromosome segregation protein
VQFTQLRLAGFKSFVEPTEVPIEPGLTGIVGPNGCGKSNLVEALRWVMGETSARRMRGGAMDDVIFAGTTSRPARNLAEVTLRIDNADRKAPNPFNDVGELEITRRIEREYGSTYKVNGREVRARDVQLLFADLATGAHSPAMVSQGRVGALINAKPGERRALLEEAAGITGLHSRRHEAELRLKAAEQNLARLTDVMQQMDVQLQGLKRQARQATRYRNLSGHIRRAEGLAFHLRHAAATAALETARAELTEAERMMAERTGLAAQASTAQAEAAAALPPLRQSEAEAAARLQRLLVARETLEQEERRQAAESDALAARLAQATADLAREEALRREAAETLARLQNETAELTAAGEGEAEREAAARAALEAAEQRQREVEAELDRLNAAVARETAERNRLTQELAGIDRRLERLAARANDAAQEQARLGAGAGDDEAAKAAAAEAERLDAVLTTAREALATAERDLEAANQADRLATQALREAEGRETRLAAEERGLARLLSVSEGDLWPPLIDALTVTPGYEVALAAALGDDLNAGTDTVAPLHWTQLPPYDETAPLPEGVVPLAQYVSAPATLGRRLAQIGLVEEADGARLQPLLKPGQRLVSRTGALWRWDGYTMKAGTPTPAAMRLEQRNRLGDLRAQLAALGAEVAQARSAQSAAAERTAAAREAELTHRRSVREADQALSAARNAEAAALRRATERATRLAALAAQMEEIAAERTDATARRDEAAAALAALPDEQIARDAVANTRTIVGELRQAAAQAARALEQVRAEARTRAARIQSLTNDARQWEGRMTASTAQIAELGERRAGLEQGIAARVDLPATFAAKRANLLDEISVAEAARREQGDLLAAAEQRQSDCDKAARAAQEAQAEAREIRARAESEAAHRADAVTEVVARIREALDCAPEETLKLAEVDEGEELPELALVETRLERLRKERDGMGPVNLRADIEAEEIETQLTSLATEKADLEGAIARLRQGIQSLNKEARERLLEAFNKVDAHFKSLFTTVFGGGEAHLQMVEAEDPLEAGLEIMASPPGKKLQVLSLLSGGEQALTALALLFAVFLTNPAPICVLDEVDAPLDDANVDRLCDLLEAIVRGGGTRFVVVTHHPITMARMDRLYGVTMAERGVSQLVSVDLGAVEVQRKTA